LPNKESIVRPLRRQLLVAFSSLLVSPVSWGQTSPLDAVSVYLIPLDDFPDELASSLARALQSSMGFRVKASLKLPPLRIDSLPGTNQLAVDSVLDLGRKASDRLPETTPKTHRVFLTLRDINSRSANFRFLFSSHNKSTNSSVVSLARMLEYADERPQLTERAALRLLKMVKRAIGELHLGWSRSPDPNDLMYSPLMGVDDLDRMGLEHTEQAGDREPAPPAPKSPVKAVISS
jgi:predicted Zn-dependent protease